MSTRRRTPSTDCANDALTSTSSPSDASTGCTNDTGKRKRHTDEHRPWAKPRHQSEAAARQYRLDRERQLDLFTKKAEPLVKGAAPDEEPPSASSPAQLPLLKADKSTQLDWAWSDRPLVECPGLSSHHRALEVAKGPEHDGSITVEQDIDKLIAWEVHPKTDREALTTGEWLHGGLHEFLNRRRDIWNELAQLDVVHAFIKVCVAIDAVQEAVSVIRAAVYDRNSQDRLNAANALGRMFGLLKRREPYSAEGVRTALERSPDYWAREHRRRKLAPGEKFVTDAGVTICSLTREIEIETRGALRLRRVTYERELADPLTQRLIRALDNFKKKNNAVGHWLRTLLKVAGGRRRKSKSVAETLIPFGQLKYRDAKPWEWFDASVAFSRAERDIARQGWPCQPCKGSGYFLKHKRADHWTEEARPPPAADVRCRTCQGSGTWRPILPHRRTRFFEVLLATKLAKTSEYIASTCSCSSSGVFENGEKAALPRASSPDTRAESTGEQGELKRRARGGRREDDRGSSSAERSRPNNTAPPRDLRSAGQGEFDDRANVAADGPAASSDARSQPDPALIAAEEQALQEALAAFDSDPEFLARLEAAGCGLLVRRVQRLKKNATSSGVAPSKEGDQQ